MAYLRFVTMVGLIVLTGCNLVSDEQPVAIIVTSPPILTCEQLVSATIDIAGDACIELEPGEACYGHSQVSAEFYPDATVRFNLPGDHADLAAIQWVNTTALSELAQTWGVALLKALVDQHEVTLVLYGDASLGSVTPDVSDATLSTSPAMPSCGPPAALLIQAPEDAQLTLKLNDVDITLGSTVHITAVENQAMTIAALEGTVVVAAANATRIIRPGAQVQVALAGLNASGAPSEPAPFDIASIQDSPLVLLDRPVQLPQPIAGPTVAPIGSTLVTSTVPPLTEPPLATRTPGECEPRSDWTDSYTVARGDNLSSIARRFGLTVRELQAGNCIVNPDLIRTGQVFQVPEEVTTDAREAVSTTVDIGTPTTANFRADERSLDMGQCTTIRWDVDNVTGVQFEEQAATSHGSQEVCPTETRSYRLVVVYLDGREVPYTLLIEVNGSPAATEDVP